MIDKAVKKILQKHVPPHSKILLGTSGGGDSQALFHILIHLQKCLQIELITLGIDHGLRDNAEKELEHPQLLAEQYGILFSIRNLDINTSGNILAEARKQRYLVFYEYANSINANYIVMAHTATDQLETFLMNFIRGSSLRGLSAMRVLNDILIRPFLGVKRKDIIAYLNMHNISFASDPTNQDTKYFRPLLRTKVLPYMREINPKIEDTILEFTENIRQDEDYLQNIANIILKKSLGPLNSLCVNTIRSTEKPIARRILVLWLKLHHIKPTRYRILELLEGSHKKLFKTHIGGRSVRMERLYIWFDKKIIYPEKYIKKSYTHIFNDLGFTLKISEKKNDKKLGDGRFLATFDSQFFSDDLKIRSWSYGDKIYPYKATGSIKLGDLLTNYKIPLFLRKNLPVIVYKDEIIWIPFLRRSHHAPVSLSSKKIIEMSVEKVLPFYLNLI